MASTRNVATAAFAIPLMAKDPFGIFMLKREKIASVSKSIPTPDKIVIIMFSSFTCRLIDVFPLFLSVINITYKFQNPTAGIKMDNIFFLSRSFLSTIYKIFVKKLSIITKLLFPGCCP